MKLYTKDGWLDAEHIERVADKNNISFIVIIGKRQIGKTYGVLKLMLDSDKRFVLLRGMKTELEMLERNVNSPFEKIHGYEGKILFEKNSDYTADIFYLDVDADGNDVKRLIGMGGALSSIGRVRGFNGDIFTDVVFDEFIPESHLLKVRHGDDAFLNMYTTISGNREIEGKPPLRVWLLANSNNLDSDILNALNLSKVVEKMSLRGEESRIIKERGIMVILPDSEIITNKRRKGALYRAIDTESKFAKMAYSNEFSYNDFTDVRAMPLNEYKPLISVGDVIIHIHKNDKTIYITEPYRIKDRLKRKYQATERDLLTFEHDYPELRRAYMKGRIIFQSMLSKNNFIKYINL